jgi:1-acyl-sn-glycerol-3-phosphate acyltransferase
MKMILFCSFLVISAAVGVDLAVRWGGSGIFPAVLLAAACFVACNILYLIVNYIVALCVNGSRHVNHPRPYYAWNVAQAAELICIYCGLHIHVSGGELLPAGKRYLFVSNHRSNMDPIIIMHKLRKHEIAFISKEANLKIPIVGKFIHECCFLPIDRENARNAIATINTAAEYLQNDVVSVGIYPEGTRSKSVYMGEFHAGSFKIAQKANVPIVVASVAVRKMYQRTSSGVRMCTLILSVLLTQKRLWP